MPPPGAIVFSPPPETFEEQGAGCLVDQHADSAQGGLSSVGYKTAGGPDHLRGLLGAGHPGSNTRGLLWPWAARRCPVHHT